VLLPHILSLISPVSFFPEAAAARAKAKTTIEQIPMTFFIVLLQESKHLTHIVALVLLFGISPEIREKFTAP